MRIVFLLIVMLVQGAYVHAESIPGLIQRASAILSDEDASVSDSLLTQLIDATEKSKNLAEKVTVLGVLGETYIRQGNRDDALVALKRAIDGAQQLPDSMETSAQIKRIAVSYRSLGAWRSATKIMERSERITGKYGSKQERIAALRQLASLQGETEVLDTALKTYARIFELLEPSDFEIVARVRVNQLKVLVRKYENGHASIGQEVDLIRAHLNEISSPTLKQTLLIEAAAALLRLKDVVPFQVEIAEFLNSGLAIARASNDEVGASYSYGYLGKLSEERGEMQAALDLSRRALVALSQFEQPETVYLWQWQIGRIHGRLGHIDAAIANYERALDSIAIIRSELLLGGFSVFRDRVLPVYRELIDILLRASQGQAGQGQMLLSKVQETIEGFNTAEVLDYFHSDCLLPRNWMKPSDVPENTAVIYPIALPDRLVILAAMGGELHQHIADVPEASVREVVLEFRQTIEDVGSAEEDYQEPGEQLYDWIVLPFLDEFQDSGIETLVFVPAAMFRSIPMSSLYDGEEYLIQNFKIATTLGLNLTDPAPFGIDRTQILLAGISDAVQGFEALPGVAQELTEISSIMGGDKFLNNEFSLGEVSKKLAVGSYSMVHFATHGVFASEYTDSYLLTYDERLTLGRLQSTVGKRRYLDNPLELLVLSACETAAGNDRAALGLAGVALKAGAKASIASLWLIGDEATARLMTRFYKELAGGKSKAEALQAAQHDLVGDPIYSHPNFWSPFLLVGNWL